MRAKLKGTVVLLAVTAAVVIGAETARADQKATLEGTEISWDGKGEIQLTPDDDGELSLSLRLTGNVVVRGEQLVAKADRLTCNAAKKVVSLESTGSGQVQLSFQMPDDGPTLRLAARKIIISLSDGRVKVEGAGTLSTPGEKRHE